MVGVIYSYVDAIVIIIIAKYTYRYNLYRLFLSLSSHKYTDTSRNEHL